MKSILKGVVAHPSTVRRSTLQRASIVIGEAATPCCMHASRFSINTLLQLILIAKSVIECIILRIRIWIWFIFPRSFVLIPNSRFEYCVHNHKKLKVGSEKGQIFKCNLHTNW